MNLLAQTTPENIQICNCIKTAEVWFTSQTLDTLVQTHWIQTLHKLINPKYKVTKSKQQLAIVQKKITYPGLESLKSVQTVHIAKTLYKKQD